MMIHRQTLRLLYAFLLLLLFSSAKSQDIHFTLQQMTPLAFNPANTGAFYGSYRLSGLYRDQYRSVAGPAAFTTPTFSVDVPVIRGFKKTDWVGVGMFFYTDKSGTGGLTQQTFKISAAYHLALNKSGSSILSIAYQTGSIQRFIKDPSKLVFGDYLESNGQTNVDMGNVDSKKKGYLDHVGGLRFSSKYNKTDEFYIGVSADRFGRPDWSLLTKGGNYRVHPKAYGQIGMSTLLSDKLRLLPNISYQKILNTKDGKSHESTFVVQGLIDYLYDKEKEVVLKGGLGYRSGQGIGDALQVMIGADIKQLRVMLGYDVNISTLSAASSAAGGFEISAQYVGKIYKRPKPDPIIFCPRF